MGDLNPPMSHRRQLKHKNTERLDIKEWKKIYIANNKKKAGTVISIPHKAALHRKALSE